MRKLKLFFACLLMAVLSIGQVWAADAAVDDVLWSEDFSGFSSNADPSGTYSSTHSGTTVFSGNVTYEAAAGTDSKPKVATEASGATGMNLLLYKKNGTFTISSIPTGGATEVTLAYYKGGSGTLSITGSSNITINGSTITINSGESFSLTFKNTHNSNNLRLDNLSVVVKTAGEGGGDEPGGDEPGEDPEPTVTFNYSDYKGEGVTSEGSPYTMEKTQVSIGDTKFYGNNNYAHFYASGVTTITPAAGVTITKMVLTASAENYNGYQSSGTVTASVGSVSHEGVVVTWTGSTDEAFTISHNKQIRWTTIVVTYEEGEAPTVAKPTINGDTYFYASSEVSMTCATDGAEIRYTLDGSDPTASSTLYENPFSLTETKTVKAIAIKGTDVSAIADKEFTKATVKTVAEALAMSATEDVYVTGYISTITEVSTSYKNATYRISDDGTTTGEMIVYHGKYINNTDFTEENKDNIHVGDKVIVRGGLVLYNSAMQLATGNYLISIEYPEVAIPTFEPAAEGFLESVEVTLACSTDGAEIRYTLDGTDPTTTSTLYENPFTLTATTTVKAIAIKGGTTTAVVSKTYTKQEVMTVAEALASSAATGVYVKGIISTITEVSTQHKNATYRISDNGSKSGEMIVYRGKYLNNTDFTSEDQIELGDEVIVYGNLVLFNSAMQLTTGNYLISLVRKASAGLAWSAESVELTVGDEFTAPTLSNPNNLTVTIASDNTELATVKNGVVSLVENATGTAKISATFAGNDQYKAASVTYSITVNASETPVDTRKVANSPATFTTTSGDLNPADIAFEAFKGGAGTAPANYNNGIRLYQISGSNAFGGYITLTAVAGCTIDEVQITTTSTYSTTVAYSKDGNENLLKSESVSASGSYTTGTGLNVQSVNIVNLGTSGSGRLEIASIKVYYTGEALTIDHYELGGTYATEFEVGDDFNHNGLIVYAAYDALGENKVDITAACTFSTPDMSAEGEQTIEITYKEAVVKSYTITVNASTDTRKVADSPAEFEAVSGNMSPADITYVAEQGGAANAPYLTNGAIRLYQISSTNSFGGFVTLKAAKGCTIDQVRVITTNSYATTVAYSVDNNENLLGSESVAKSGTYTTPADLNAASVNILNLGTGSNGRLEIASIKVWYTGDPLAVDHYFLGGTYATEFEQFGTFNYEGLTVTAAYDAGETITEAVTGFTVEADLSTAGAKKAEVYLGLVKIAEYDITVNASAKQDPALAYDPTSVILTKGDALSAPTFSNTHNVSPITYESSKPAVATVDAEGNITLAGGTGVAVITASFAGDDGYIESEATFTITVNEPTEDLSGTWVKATSVAAGDRIIIGATVTAGTKTMGLQNTNNRAAVASTLDEYGVLTPAEGTKTFLVVNAGDGKFALQALNGKYLTSATSGTGNNLLEAANYENDNAKWTITIDGEGVASVVAAAGNRTYMKYNNGSTLFSCYQYETSQSPINIYKKGTPDYGSYEREGLTIGNYATICLPKAGTIANAKLFDLEYYDGSNTLYLLEVEGNAMVAGRPYIFLPSATSITVTYTDAANEDAGSFNGLVGWLGNENKLIAQNDGNYILYNNAYYLVNSTAYVGVNRAYIHMGDVPTEPSTPQVGQAPRRRVGMSVHGEKTTTDIDALNAAEAPVKVLINGQMYILRGEKMFNANGQLVK